MRAAQIERYGGPEVIKVSDVPKPPIQAGHILVDVRAASLNRIDSAIRSGGLAKMMPLKFPVTLGGDFAGVVAETGEGVTDFKIGDEVYGQSGILMGGSGSLAEFTVAAAGKMARKPRSIDMAAAASLPLVGTSAVQGIEEHINIQKGQKILIHGGAGGIGSLAIQIAKLRGAYVATTVATDEIDFAKRLGADEVIDYKKQNFALIVKEYDAVFVTTPAALDDSYAVLKKGGVLVAMNGPMDGAKVTRYGIKAIQQMTQANTAQLTRLAGLVDSGSLKPIVEKRFPLDEIKAAFDYFEQQRPKGKVVVIIK